MKKVRTFLLSAVLAFTVLAASIQQAQAVLPVLVYAVARQAVVMTAEAVTVGVIAKGFAANDPYVRTTATISKARFAQNLSKSKLGFWGAAISLGAVFLPTNWFYDAETEQLMVSESPPADSQCIESPNWGCGTKHAADKVWTESEDIGACSVNGVLYKSCADVTTWFSGEWDGGTCHSKCVGYVYRVANGEAEVRPVTPAEIESKILPQLITATNLPDSFANADLAAIFDGAAIPYNPALANPSVASLVDAYNKGLLQTADPSAPYYVDPGTLEQVKNWADAANDAVDNVVSDAELDALNEKMKQPITQAQYEETNKKYADGVDAVTAALGSQGESDYSEIDDHFNELDGIITDLPNASLPAPADISVPQYVDCQQIHLTDGNGHDLYFPSPSQCAKIETFKQGFGYFLAVSVVFLLGMQLLTRPHG